MLFHAFYSDTMVFNAKKLAYIKLKKNPCIELQIITQLYKLVNTNSIVETTCLYNIENYPDVNKCEKLYNDFIYLGIVDNMISVGKTI